MNRLLTFLISTFLVTGCIHTRQDDSTGAADERIDVIAVLAGYEGSMPLSTGQSIPFYTIDPQQAGAYRFLFSILLPTKMSGQFFFVCDDMGPVVKDPSRLFKLGSRYRFSVSPSNVYNAWPPAANLRGAKEVSITKEEVDVYKTSLNKRETFCKQQIADNQVRLKKLNMSASREALIKAINIREQEVLWIETQKVKAVGLLKNAKDDFPYLLDLKWQALDDEGWETLPRESDIKKSNEKTSRNTNGQPDGVTNGASSGH